MPNWTENLLTIGRTKDTKPKDFRKIINAARKTARKRNEPGYRGFMSEFLPCPEELRGTTSPDRLGDLVGRCPEESGKLLDGMKSDEGRRAFQELIDGRKRLINRYGCTEWYTWQNRSWGCKWDFMEADASFDEDAEGKVTAVHMEFQTPWGPPEAFLKWLAHAFSVTVEDSYLNEGDIQCDEDGEPLEDQDRQYVSFGED